MSIRFLTSGRSAIGFFDIRSLPTRDVNIVKAAELWINISITLLLPD